MGHRLSRIYTRTGDDGTTGLGDGERTPKDSRRIVSIGSIDELNSVIGLLIAELEPGDELQALFADVQHDLFDLGGELSMPGMTLVEADRVTWLEAMTDNYNEDLPPLKNFILPGGSRAAAVCHMARSVCRRAERDLVSLAREEGENVGTSARQYLNRLSDLLFVCARVIARRDGGSEVLWRQRKPD
jgi:cob(I)alamin adenosyltransferase